MPIFKIDKSKVEQLELKENGFGNEAELRDFFSANLENLLGVRFLENEFRTQNGRIDTLGIDEDNTPVIIEYKWKENEEVLTQGLSYLAWLQKNRRHFELLVESKLGSKVEVSWDQPRVILIAQGFSRRIQDAVHTIESVELKTYALYEGGTLQLESEYSPRPERSSSSKKIDEVDETPIYDLNFHLNLTSSEMQKAFLDIREKILQLPSVEERAGQKSGITYATTRSFARFEFRGTWIQLLVRDASYVDDTNDIVRDVTTHLWGYKGMIKFTSESDFNAVFTIVEASYKSTL